MKKYWSLLLGKYTDTCILVGRILNENAYSIIPRLLYPLDTDVAKTETKKHEDTWRSIKLYLDDIKEGEDISFDELLLKLKVTEENYLIAIRLSITPNAPTVFLKRNPNELQINNYNPACLSAWRANMDIQYKTEL